MVQGWCPTVLGLKVVAFFCGVIYGLHRGYVGIIWELDGVI